MDGESSKSQNDDSNAAEDNVAAVGNDDEKVDADTIGLSNSIPSLSSNQPEQTRKQEYMPAFSDALPTQLPYEVKPAWENEVFLLNPEQVQCGRLSN